MLGTAERVKAKCILEGVKTIADRGRSMGPAGASDGLCRIRGGDLARTTSGNIHLLRAAAGRCRFGSWRDLWHPFRTKSEH
jgi:hypothetical protein